MWRVQEHQSSALPFIPSCQVPGLSLTPRPGHLTPGESGQDPGWGSVGHSAVCNRVGWVCGVGVRRVCGCGVWVGEWGWVCGVCDCLLVGA